MNKYISFIRGNSHRIGINNFQICHSPNAPAGKSLNHQPMYVLAESHLAKPLAATLGSVWCFAVSWWRHQMETFSALLAICAGNSPVTGKFLAHTGQWHGPLMFSLIWAWMDGWVNNGEAGDLRRYRAHYDAIAMMCLFTPVRQFFVWILKYDMKCVLWRFSFDILLIRNTNWRPIERTYSQLKCNLGRS